MSRCGICGSDRQAGRFCSNCGARSGTSPVDELLVDIHPEPSAGAPTDGVPGEASTLTWARRLRVVVGRWRAVVVIVPLLAGLAVAIDIGSDLLWAEIPDESIAAPSLTCWDGSTAATVADCGRPRGVEGLQWVFPSFEPEGQGCRDVLLANPGYKRPAMWACESSVGGRPVEVIYSELTSVASAKAFISREYDGVEASTVSGRGGEVVRHVWRAPADSPGEPFTFTTMYADFPFAVSVSATSAADREQVVRRGLALRPVREMVVRRGRG